MIEVDGQLREQRLRARRALERSGRLSFKSIRSAKWTNVSVSRSGAMRAQIEHDDIKGATPRMMRWWFENLAATTTWNGTDFTGPEVSHYHLWHHRDHIKVTPLTSSPGGPRNNGFQVGALSRIDEQFNDYGFRVHQVMRTIRLDDAGFDFQILGPGGMVGGLIIHRYAPVPGGVSFYCETRIDLRIPVLGPALNRLVRPLLYSQKTADQWIRHNIEETGRTEDVVPHLFAHAAEGRPELTEQIG